MLFAIFILILSQLYHGVFQSHMTVLEQTEHRKDISCLLLRQTLKRIMKIQNATLLTN